jgi:LmbE family N-acetylglucosaminyl deacetylase
LRELLESERLRCGTLERRIPEGQDTHQRGAAPDASGIGRLEDRMTERTFSSALVLFAHPDDAEFMCGGTIAAWARDGCEVHYVVVTDGSAGSNDPEVTREQLRPVRDREQRAAAAVLGVRSVTFLGEVDGMLEVSLDTRRKVCREVRRLRPEVLVAPDPSRLWSGRGYVNHWDHKQAGLLALTAVMPDAPSRPMFPELLAEGIEPYEVPNLWLTSDQPDVYVDITDTIETKLAALAEHVSQGTEEARSWVRKWAETLGAKSGQGFELAEGFKALRLVDDEEDQG